MNINQPPALPIDKSVYDLFLAANQALNALSDRLTEIDDGRRYLVNRAIHCVLVWKSASLASSFLWRTFRQACNPYCRWLILGLIQGVVVWQVNADKFPIHYLPLAIERLPLQIGINTINAETNDPEKFKDKRRFFTPVQRMVVGLFFISGAISSLWSGWWSARWKSRFDGYGIWDFLTAVLLLIIGFILLFAGLIWLTT